jgi:hypothetical protein
VLLGWLALLVQRVPLVRKGLLVQIVQCPARKALRVLLVPLVRKAFKVLRGLKGLLVLTAQCPAHKALRVPLVRKAFKVLQVLKGLLVQIAQCPAHKVHKAFKAWLVRLVLMVLMAKVCPLVAPLGRFLKNFRPRILTRLGRPTTRAVAVGRRSTRWK